MDSTTIWVNLEEYGKLSEEQLASSNYRVSRPRRNAIIPFSRSSGGLERNAVQLRRNAVAPFVLRDVDYDYESDEVQVSHSRVGEERDQEAEDEDEDEDEDEETAPAPAPAPAPATALATASATEPSTETATDSKASKQKEKGPTTVKPDNEIHYIRAGRRTIEDESGDIPTQFIVVAKIDKAKSKVTWLSVATWQLNGLRIGTVASGDRIKDDEFLSFAVSLDPDPFFVARNVSSRGIPELLLERVARGELGVQEETLSDGVAQRERCEAQDSRMLAEYGPGVIYSGERAVRKIAARQDVNLRFAHPWALPTALTRSTLHFPTGLEGFSGIASDVAIESMHVVATFANEIDGGRDLRLKHFMQVAFEPDETLESAKRYLLKGDGSAEFRGLESNRFLARKWWLLEVWVLPHCHGCSTLYKWDDTPELTARAFCDAKAFESGWGIEPRLYIEVRIVQDPDHVGGEDVSSTETESEP